MFNNRLKFIGGSKFHVFCQELFYALSGALVLFVVMEIIKPQIVTVYLNLSFWLLLWCLNAMILLLFKPGK
ncbi:hypothetical protein COX68_02705 [Candidatus Falkowbacteria bacterium CG_4_10_14_0_2_um_filter_41_15]|uniref:Uncharacterized protein n=4 Tax=Candidatus Falkowiibacteriota TaxID=1752728 RepID=A0A2G9ZNR5_9BACT|nr:MAG: hypothetical protein AUJ35_02855 [Candidatus Falkowbacteria bacterium CG1_02_41_21]PIP34823.1 MAG: hypothetical protein COX21_00825 [Candidatus Falkowbacteria bacterium CG23_combo_of_CG06-09_8_20_14_all_41_10]PIZ10393.1 MAG: hypothetical protein COY54_01625 [Candidatus Falkowbacteria bacterium CG_4_10_14_0_8_um_filter_41_36]PJA09494.1 MAG: hypothetical protein COX68_02705 [Candidatus Falkowbacteria bacterium CG_4_10_14_0_2_um_filter_41_15]